PAHLDQHERARYHGRTSPRCTSCLRRRGSELCRHGVQFVRLGSTVIVRAAGMVLMVCNTANVPGFVSCATVIVPSPFELNANPVPGSNLFASTPDPIGTVPTTAPRLMSEIAITLL